jgi:antitoxin component of MazEF toxin-antitoxin module
MVLRIQRIGDDYGVVFPREALEALRLAEGAEVEVRAVANGANGNHPTESKPRYVTVAEALESYERTEPFHRNTYRELAK